MSWGGARLSDVDIRPLADAITRGDLTAANIELDVIARRSEEWRADLDRSRSQFARRKA